MIWPLANRPRIAASFRPDDSSPEHAGSPPDATSQRFDGTIQLTAGNAIAKIVARDAWSFSSDMVNSMPSL